MYFMVRGFNKYIFIVNNNQYYHGLSKICQNKHLDRKSECEYGAWDDWSPCTKETGIGVKTRMRKNLIKDCKPPTVDLIQHDEIEQSQICMKKYTSTNICILFSLIRFLLMICKFDRD